MANVRKVVPLEMSDAEVKSLIVETISRSQDIFPKLKIDKIVIGARQANAPQGVFSATRISTSLGDFDISNHRRIVGIAPKPNSGFTARGELSAVVKALFEAWCPDWKSLAVDFSEGLDSGGWSFVRQRQLPEEICIFPNVCRIRFYGRGSLDNFSRTDLNFSRTEPVRLSISQANEIIKKFAKSNKLDISEAPELQARLEGETMRACYVARGIGKTGYSATVVLDADSGEVLRADK